MPRVALITGAASGIGAACARALAADGLTVAVTDRPLGRIGTPDEIAAAVRFLVSKAAGYITGSVIDVNGGSRMQ